MPLSYRPEKDPFAIFLASIFTLFIFLGIFSPYLPSRIIPKRESVTRPNQRNIQNKPCEGYKDCSYEVRQKLEGAGWQLAGDVVYYGEGVHYAVGAKPMETGVKEIYYTMDCNCEPQGVRFK
jgi:hypothetical protein